MADKKIGELPKVTDLYSESLIPVEQQGKAMHMTGKQFSDFGKSVVQEYVEGAVEAAEQATASQEAAAKSASDAETSANTAKTHADAAKKSEDAASASETNAENSAAAAKESQDAAKESADTASAGAKVVTDNKASLDAVADNVEAIQNAASNAQKAQESADAAAEDAAKAEAAAKNAQAIAQGQKGYFEDPEALRAAVPQGEDGDWAIVGTTDTIWIWDADTGAWTDSGQNIDMSNYYTKTEAQTKLSGAAGQAVGFDADGNAQAVEVGGRNLILNSNTPQTGTYAIGIYTLSEALHTGDAISVKAKLTLAEGRNQVVISSSGGLGTYYLTDNKDGTYQGVFPSLPAAYENTKRIEIYALPNNGDNGGGITEIKLERGLVATDWTPAPEDIQTELDGKQDKISSPADIGAQATLTGTVGQVVGFNSSGAAQAVEVGGRNLFILCNSVSGYLNDNSDGTILPPSSSSINERTSDYIQVEKGEILTIQTWATALSGIVYGRYMFDYQWFKEKSPESHIGNKTRFTGGELGFNHAIGITNPAPDEAKYIRVDARFYSDGKIKVERGSIATDWTPAPEDAFEALYKRTMHLYNATFTVNGWVGNDNTGYTQNVSITPQDGGPEVTAATQLDIPMVRHTGEQEADEAMDEALAIVNAGTVTPGEGTVTVKVWEKPETEITVFWYGR